MYRFKASHHVHPLETPMKTQRILASLLATIFVTLSGAHAQKPNGSTKPVVSHADAHLATLSTKLTLTPDEKGKIKPILDNESAKIDALKMDKSLSDVNRKAKIEPIRDDADKQIRAVLTPAQQKIYDSMSKKAESGGTKKPGGKKSAPAPKPGA
jgi:periplasmic protein CpxP/Spy